MSEFELYLPHYCILEIPIRESTEVCEAAKIYFGELAVLNSKREYIPYTDEQLSKMKGVSLRTIKSWHEQLEAAGFIRRETQNVLVQGTQCQWKKERKMYIYQNPNSKKVSERAENCTSDDRAEFCTFDDRAENCTISNKRQDKKKNNNRTNPDPNPPDPDPDEVVVVPFEKEERRDPPMCQGNPGAGVLTYKAMDELPFKEAFKRRVRGYRKADGSCYSEEEIRRAVAITKVSSYRDLPAFFTDALKNPDKYEFPKSSTECEKENFNQVKEMLEEFDLHWFNERQLDISPNSILINFKGNCESREFLYKNDDFWETFCKYVQKHMPDLWKYLNEKGIIS